MNDRTLGTIATICAPALLIEGILTEALNLGDGQQAIVVGLAGPVFMASWICSNAVMRRTRAAGTGRWGRAVLLVQLVGLAPACLFGLFEATGLLGRDDLAFNVMDTARPLSMAWMLVVGVTVVVARRMQGWRRFVPLAYPLSLLVGPAATPVPGENTAGLFGFGLAAIFWTAPGYVVCEERNEPLPGPALQ